MRVRFLMVLAAALAGALVLAAAGGAFSGAKRATSLNGAEECDAAGNCGLGDSDGSGSAAITFNVGQATVCWELTWANIGEPAAGHIHRAPAGVAGPVVIPLHNAANQLVASGCRTADPALIQEIIDNPAGFYVNLHNSDFPAGAIRGQLSNRGQLT
jgi:hypothetical protein